mmetsp:Transcript_33086/g.50609  ORF Transcript_33086/g.50609 Transcript_33086/m.50609 type:complete len:160 (-) Transcript_33086:115-594(-)
MVGAKKSKKASNTVLYLRILIGLVILLSVVFFFYMNRKLNTPDVTELSREKLKEGMEKLRLRLDEYKKQMGKNGLGDGPHSLFRDLPPEEQQKKNLEIKEHLKKFKEWKDNDPQWRDHMDEYIKDKKYLNYKNPNAKTNPNTMNQNVQNANQQNIKDPN